VGKSRHKDTMSLYRYPRNACVSNAGFQCPSGHFLIQTNIEQQSLEYVIYSVSMPVRAFLDSDSKAVVVYSDGNVGFNARQGIS